MQQSPLAQFDADYSIQRQALLDEVGEAEAAASVLRDGLLYGAGARLVAAVREVLELAGIAVIDLDQQLGGTKNADLLCTLGGRSRIVEVKSASGNAPERAYQDLVRHLREWQTVPAATPVVGGALVINHQIRSLPHSRSTKPYSRPEFLSAQTEPVIAALDLFAAWCNEDSDAIQRLIFPEAEPSTASVPISGAAAEGRPTPEKRSRWFRR